MVFWDTVRPIDDPFWSAHKPGDRWGCQCALEATDEPETGIPDSSPKDEPAPGLENNPGKDGELFSDNHPYFSDSCSTCPFYRGAQSTAPSNRAKDCYHCQYIESMISSGEVSVSGVPSKYEDFGRGWIREFKQGNGYLVTEKERIPVKKSGNEWEKYAKEHTMCVNIAKAEHKIVHLRERKGLYDVLCDGQPADLKKTKSVSNLDHYVSHALKDQKAKMVLIEFELENKDVHSKLKKYEKEGIPIIYYFTGRETEIYTL